MLDQSDARLTQICTPAKAGTNATVYTIGLELAGQLVTTAALQDCWPSPSAFYLSGEWGRDLDCVPEHRRRNRDAEAHELGGHYPRRR